MEQKIIQVAVYQGAQNYQHAYLKIETDQIFISQSAVFNSEKPLKCQPNLTSNLRTVLKIQIWNYEPLKLIKFWEFGGEQVLRMKNKHMLQEDGWTLYLKKAIDDNVNKQNSRMKNNGSIDMMRPLLKTKAKTNNKSSNATKRQEISAILDNKGKKDKQSIKKTLKSTIDYLIKQQSQIMNCQEYGIQETSRQIKTGKCTPASEQISNFKSQSTLFSEYGLNITELNSKYSKDIQKNNKQSKKRSVKIR